MLNLSHRASISAVQPESFPCLPTVAVNSKSQTQYPTGVHGTATPFFSSKAQIYSLAQTVISLITYNVVQALYKNHRQRKCLMLCIWRLSVYFLQKKYSLILEHVKINSNTKTNKTFCSPKSHWCRVEWLDEHRFRSQTSAIPCICYVM